MSQVGGSHYEDMAIQPWEIIERNNLDYWEGNIIKYILRHRTKNGVEDLLKAQHYLNHLINLEVGKLEPIVPHASSKSSDGLDNLGHSGIFYTSNGTVSVSARIQDKE